MSGGAPAGGREARWQAVYSVLLTVLTALVTVTLLFSKTFFGWYNRPAFFGLFRFLSFLQLGLFVAALTSVAAWSTRRLPVPLRALLVLPGVVCAGWLTVWSIVHGGFGIRLSVQQVWDLLRAPETLAVAGLTPSGVLLRVAALCVGATGLAFAIQAAAARSSLRFVRRAAWFALGGFGILHGAVRGWVGYHTARNQRAVLMLDEGMPLALRSETLLPGMAGRRFQFASLAEPARTDAYLEWARRAPAPAIPHKLNILWFSLDSFRFDAITDSTTPSLFAHRGEFQLRLGGDHWSGANMTRGGIFSMLMGLSAYHLQEGRRAGLSVPLLTLLAQNGYRLRIAKGLSFYYGDLRGFLPSQAEVAEVHAPSMPAGDRAMVDSLLLDLERRNPTRPAFDLLTFDSTHWPYDDPSIALTGAPGSRPERIYRAVRSEATVRSARGRYAKSLRFEDAELGRVLERLRAKGALARTIVIVTGDHGEEFLERGQLGHGAGVNDYQARVPLWISFPSEPQVPPQSGFSSQLDIVPTLLDYLGFDHDVLRTQGRSLLRPGPAPPLLMVAEQGWSEPAYHAVISPTYISRWRESGRRFLFSSVERRDGAPVIGSAWWDEVRASRPAAAAGYEVFPDVRAPLRAFSDSLAAVLPAARASLPSAVHSAMPAIPRSQPE
jgi:membrane-anchored protein YejM (alkaline phosphatase superfamily)